MAAGPAGALWAEVLEQVEKRPRLRSLLARLVPVALDGPVLVLRAAGSAAAMAKDHAAEIAGLAGRVTGRSMRVEIVTGEGEASSSRPDQSNRPVDGPAPAGRATEERGVAAADADDPALHPLVQQALEVFGAKVTRVEKRAKEQGEHV